MQKIMGGEFEITDNLIEKEITSRHNIIFSSGRNALFNILHSERISGGILIPNYLCDSITKAINEAGWRYKFYKINRDLQFDVDEIISCKDIDAVLVINYFGMLKLEDSIRRIKQARPNLVIIEDDVQAFFEYKNSEADYSFTSLRKWFPCPDGAFISTKRTLNMKTMVENKWSQYKFAGNILKKYNNVIDDSICLELLQKGEELLDVEYRSACSDISQVIFAHVDIETIAKKRMNNAAYLHSKLEKLGIRHAYRESAVPLFVPIFIENRTTLRRRFLKTIFLLQFIGRK